VLALTAIEPRESPVAIDWSFAPDPWLLAREGLIRTAGDTLAAALSRPGVERVGVFVGTRPLPGALADATPLGPWAGGGVIRFDTGRPWDAEFDLGSVVRHELLHVLGAGHTADPTSLLWSYAPRQPVEVNRTDMAELARVGWTYTPPGDGLTGSPAPLSTGGWRPFPGFAGEVRVASGDVTGDGVGDTIAAAGPGGGPHVKVRDGVSGLEVASFYAYHVGFAGGVSVAAGDLNNDGVAEVVTGAGPGGGPHVKTFDGRSMAEVRSFYAAEPGVTSGVSVTVAVSGGRIVAVAGGVVGEW
jgi:hypothetical protein